MNKEEIDYLVQYVMEMADKWYSDDFPIDHIEVWIRDYFTKEDSSNKSS